jgi:hypothetical protein
MFEITGDDIAALGDEDLRALVGLVQIPAHRGQSFRRIADGNPVIADSLSAPF